MQLSTQYSDLEPYTDFFTSDLLAYEPHRKQGFRWRKIKLEVKESRVAPCTLKVYSKSLDEYYRPPTIVGLMNGPFPTGPYWVLDGNVVVKGRVMVVRACGFGSLKLGVAPPRPGSAKPFVKESV